MTSRLIELYPEPGRSRDLAGTWLEQRVHRLGRIGAPLIYGSFVASLDGRIALADPATGVLALPAAIVTRHDFRLLQELMAQADCFITHGGYLRAIESGRSTTFFRSVRLATRQTSRAGVNSRGWRASQASWSQARRSTSRCRSRCGTTASG